MSDPTTILQWLMERCAANLACNQRAKAYLRDNGVGDESLWSAFRLGVGDERILDDLDDAGRSYLAEAGLIPGHGPKTKILCDSGILIPTFELPDAAQPVGIIKLNYGQNRHGFVTPPAGFSCAADIGAAEKVVVCDAPLLGLRLHALGVQGVVVADAPEVLSHLEPWVGDREIVLASYKKACLGNMMGGLTSALAERATAITVHTVIEDSNDAALAALGIEDAKERVIEPRLVKRVLDYAKARLGAGEGRGLLKSLGVESPEFIRAFEIGYLPADYEESLGLADGRLLRKRLLADSVIVAALDAERHPVDLLCVRNEEVGNLQRRPLGLIGGKVTGVYADVVLVDALSDAAALFNSGKKNVLLVRGAEDAIQNAERLSGSVRSVVVAVKQDHEAVVAALQGAGAHIQESMQSPEHAVVEAVDVPEAVDVAPAAVESIGLKPEFVSHDEKTDTAIFRVDDAQYHVEIPVGGGTKLQVRLERDGKVALDRFDVAVEAQRKRFGLSAAMKTGIPFEAVDSHLMHILDKACELQEKHANPTPKAKIEVVIGADERKECVEFLRRRDLLDAIAEDLAGIGWVGEEDSKRLLYLCSVSRKLLNPLSSILRAPSGAGKSMGVETVATLIPPEDVLHCSRLTEGSLYYADQGVLKHKLLVVDEADALTPEVLVALRVLQTRGSLTHSYTRRDTVSGATTTQFVEARGPVSVLMSTTREMDPQVLSRCFDVPVDESEEQTKRILEAQRHLRSDAEHVGLQGRRAKIVLRHHTLQRLLESRPVVIPFADRIEFPASSVRHRREQERFLNLIEASALLHQFQRLKQKNASGEEFIVADVADFEIAARLSLRSIERAADELSSQAREVLAVVRGAGLTTFGMDDLKAAKPDWTRYRFRAALDELLRLEVLFSPKGRRGSMRQYQVRVSALNSSCAAAVRLLKPGEVGELAKVGEARFANFIPSAAIG